MDPSLYIPNSFASSYEKKKKNVQFCTSIGSEDEDFLPTHVTFTPKISKDVKLQYRAPSARVEIGLDDSYAPPSSITRPNYDDSLRRVSVVVYQHIGRCERRLKQGNLEADGFQGSLKQGQRISSMESITGNDTNNKKNQVDQNALSIGNALISGVSTAELFAEDQFVSPQYKYTFIRVPKIHPMTIYQMKKVDPTYHIPSVDEIYRFCKHLFNRAQLSPECSIVCLIYVERLMEVANIPLLAKTWKPIVLCGLLLSSKVWQDLSTWNIEFNEIYPQFSIQSINRLERIFLHHIQWDLYISGSNYAKYYFALRSLTEKKDFRRRYNYTVKVDPPNTKRLEERTAAIKNELYSTSL